MLKKENEEKDFILNKIKEILCQFTDDYDEISSDIYEQIKEDNLEDHSIYEYYFELFQNLDYFYDCYKCYISSFNFFSTPNKKKSTYLQIIPDGLFKFKNFLICVDNVPIDFTKASFNSYFKLPNNG